MNTEKRIWTGEKYAEGWREQRRLLVLGESSYGGGENCATNLVEAYLGGRARNWGRTYTRFTQMLRGTSATTAQWTREECWSRFAFLNFIETSRVLRPGERPPLDEWHRAEAEFEKRIENFEPPHLVIIWGYRLWDGLVAMNRLSTGSTWGWGHGMLRLTSETSAACCKIQHPCRGMSHARMQEWSGWLAQTMEGQTGLNMRQPTLPRSPGWN